jgi:GcrA cell cycle regulator
MTAHNRWTPAREEHLRKLWDAGLTASECAAALGDGMTRNSVIGKIHRLGLVGRAAAKAAELKNRVYRAPVPKKQRDAVMAIAVPLPDPSQAIIAVFEPGPNAVTLEGLKPGMCRFPIGDPLTPEFRFCGEPARQTSFGSSPCPYCSAHSAISFVATRRQRTVAQQAADKKRRLMAHARKPI